MHLSPCQVAAERALAVQEVECRYDDQTPACGAASVNAITRDQTGFCEASYGGLGPAHQAVSERLKLADDIRPRWAEQQRVDEPAAIRVLTKRDIARFDHLFETGDR